MVFDHCVLHHAGVARTVPSVVDIGASIYRHSLGMFAIPCIRESLQSLLIGRDIRVPARAEVKVGFA
jgi:hypothetical protein